MRWWPIRARRRPAPPPSEDFLAAEDRLRRNVEDVLAVRDLQIRGGVIVFRGVLTTEPRRALDVLIERCRPLGYTPGLPPDADAVSVHARPLPGAAPELAVRHRGGGSAGGTGRRVPGDPPGYRVVERRAGAARRLRGVWRLPAHVGTRVSALRTDPAGAHALHAPDGRRRVGRLPRDGVEPLPGGPARRRSDRLRALRPAPPRHRQGDRHDAAPPGRRVVPLEPAGGRWRCGIGDGVVGELVRVGGPDLLPRGLSPHPAARRPLADLARPPGCRSRLSGPPRVDDPALRHSLGKARRHARRGGSLPASITARRTSTNGRRTRPNTKKTESERIAMR